MSGLLSLRVGKTVCDKKKIAQVRDENQLSRDKNPWKGGGVVFKTSDYNLKRWTFVNENNNFLIFINYYL